jgi:hypothetical protein
MKIRRLIQLLHQQTILLQIPQLLQQTIPLLLPPLRRQMTHLPYLRLRLRF